MRGLPRVLTVVLLLMLAFCILSLLNGCATTPKGVEIHEVPGPTQYVHIDPKFTGHPALPPFVSTTPIQCPAVAKERLSLLRTAYYQLDQIKAVEGTKP